MTNGGSNMKCENCSNEHDGKYGSGRFCSSKCARGFSTKARRVELNNRVSKSLSGRKNPNSVGFTDAQRKKATETLRLNAIKIREWKIAYLPFEELNKVYRRIRILEEQYNKCIICGIGTIWNNKPLSFHLDHINGNHSDNTRENLRMICPNCHTQTKNYGSKNISKKGSESIKKTARITLKNSVEKRRKTIIRHKELYKEFTKDF